VVAAREGSVVTAHIIDILAEAGALVKKADNFGLTPIQVADQCRELINIQSFRCNGVHGGWFEGEPPLDIHTLCKNDNLSDVELCIETVPGCVLLKNREVPACGCILLSFASMSSFCTSIL
jgi:hypothetical protein